MKKKIAVSCLAAALALTMTLSGCANTNDNTTSANSVNSTAEATTLLQAVTGTGNAASASAVSSAQISEADAKESWDEESATKITLADAGIAIDGAGATSAGSVLTITQAGTYVVTGTLTDGQIAVAATNNDKVHLVLQGVDITNTTGAPIYASQCDKLIITLAEGTQNVLTDGAERFAYADAANEEPNAALFCKDDLTINGAGSLTVNAGFHNGIVSKDDLLILGGDITVYAANHGLRGNDSITVTGGNFNITAGNDGMQTNNTEDTSLGWILLEGGVWNIASAHDGIQADTYLTITGGEFTITTGSNVASTDTTSDSFKGMKATGDLSVTGGSFAIVSLDDAVHANGNIAIGGGVFTLSSGDDAVHADGDLTIDGASTRIDILTSYEGLEAKTMTIADGVITLEATDDGINIAGGNDTGAGGGRFGRDNFGGGASADQWLKITGGTITVTAGSDGIDINGSGEMTGGVVDITAATLGEGETIDSDGTFLRGGGTLTETGGNSMGGMGGGGGRGGWR